MGVDSDGKDAVYIVALEDDFRRLVERQQKVMLLNHSVKEKELINRTNLKNVAFFSSFL
jgi:hypothetical protein